MIRIDHIEFGFAVPDEDFAYDLYADWDGFCRRCFERVVEDCLAPYGDDRSLYELERLVLDLGRIPEESFLDEFPGRLKAALQEALPNLRGKVSERTAEDRAANFLFYLACGYPLAEWADRNFNPQEETEWLSRQSSTFYMRDIRKLANLCVKKWHIPRRLLWQTGGGKLLLDVYAAVLEGTGWGNHAVVYFIQPLHARLLKALGKYKALHIVVVGKAVLAARRIQDPVAYIHHIQQTPELLRCQFDIRHDPLPQSRRRGHRWIRRENDHGT